MKLILSRKGCDSGTGKLPSPIFPNGQLCSLPIPELESPIRYADVALDGGVSGRGFGPGADGAGDNLGDLVAQLSRGKIVGDSGAHLDPDLSAHSRARLPGWRPLFGQAGAAAGHLRKQSVGVGDLFLFYGWFRQTAFTGDGLVFGRDAPDLHLLFGWLQVGEIYDLSAGPSAHIDLPDWAQDHPHCTQKFRTNNALFSASELLEIPSLRRRLPGGGLFRKFSQELQLTEPGALRGQWLLPRWFWPYEKSGNGRPPLTYHGDRARWALGDDGVRLRTVGRGQEFVLDCDFYAESAAWLARLFEEVA